MNAADHNYKSLIEKVLNYGDLIETRNHAAYSYIHSDTIYFTKTPLVTLRKTAWKKALREMEWFLSGEPKCPDELLDWWDGQLNPEGCYVSGYGQQLRNWERGFDQIENLIDGLINHPYSRRHVITTWNPFDMSVITELNNNPKTPSTCHLSIGQYFVRNGKLHARTYQRSCDILLGLPHNFLQHWGMLIWLANQSGYEVGSLTYNIGDAHVYKEPSHLEVANLIMEANIHPSTPSLIYNGNGDFKASDFEMVGDIPDPVTTIRPKLL